MKTRTMGIALTIAITLMIVWASIGRYDLAVIVAIGNVPLMGTLLYRLWKERG